MFCKPLPVKDGETHITGQVVHKRSISKKLLFLDILTDIYEDDKDINLATSKRITVMFKSVSCGNELMQLARTTTNKIHIGDVVRFLGNFEDNTSIFLPMAFDVIDRWETSNPGKSFCPIPPAR